ncbi:hypothetical protein HPB48_021405 [Haemaphysalis longicornis]|uniref:Uncharacterized protein n=1 Tax=Haemaphysalis longicornis TaxID=44386 RepID=A0A9J6FWN1_HAELO|nr:hypothetical protein HPB48_021405 [Haemaphysalis longicornis]
MDKASYHSRRNEAVPTTNSLKGTITEWLDSKSIQYGSCADREAAAGDNCSSEATFHQLPSRHGCTDGRVYRGKAAVLPLRVQSY